MGKPLLCILALSLFVLSAQSTRAQVTDSEKIKKLIEQRETELQELRELQRLEEEHEARQAKIQELRARLLLTSAAPAPASNPVGASQPPDPKIKASSTSDAAPVSSPTTKLDAPQSAPKDSPGEGNYESPIQGSTTARLLVGYDIVSGSRGSNSLSPNLDLYFTTPFLKKGRCENLSDANKKAMCARLRSLLQGGRVLTDEQVKQFADYLDPGFFVWGNARITGFPRQVSNPLVDLSNNFFSNIISGQVNGLVRGAEFQAGIEIPVLPVSFGIPVPGISKDTTQVGSISLIASGGAINPFERQSDQQIFNLNDEARQRFNVPAGKQYIAFVSPDRDRFFRQYYAGLRLKSYFFQQKGVDSGTSNGLILEQRFPAIFDVTIGQNEFVTGGRLRGAVTRFEGSYPLPYRDGSFLTITGTALLKLTRSVTETNPILLSSPSTNVMVTDETVFVRDTPFTDRDYFRLGLSLDIGGLFKALRSQRSTTNATPAVKPPTVAPPAVASP